MSKICSKKLVEAMECAELAYDKHCDLQVRHYETMVKAYMQIDLLQWYAERRLHEQNRIHAQFR